MKVALVGFGEVGQRLASEITASVFAWDRLFRVQDSAPRRALHRMHQVRAGSNMQMVVAPADVIISAVTAGERRAAAAEAAAAIAPRTCYLDLTSVSRETGVEVAQLIDDRGGRYI